MTGDPIAIEFLRREYVDQDRYVVPWLPPGRGTHCLLCTRWQQRPSAGSGFSCVGLSCDRLCLRHGRGRDSHYAGSRVLSLSTGRARGQPATDVGPLCSRIQHQPVSGAQPLAIQGTPFPRHAFRDHYAARGHWRSHLPLDMGGSDGSGDDELVAAGCHCGGVANSGTPLLVARRAISRAREDIQRVLRHTRLRWSPSRRAKATIVRVGFAYPPLGKTELPATNRFDVPCTRLFSSTTPCREATCMRVVPM